MTYAYSLLLLLGLSACKTSQSPRSEAKATEAPAETAEIQARDAAPTPVVVDFRETCRDTQASEATRLTIDKLLQIAEVKDCDAAWEKLLQLKELDLTSAELTDIGPLSKLVQLEQLSLSFNHVADLRPLMNLKNLNELFLGDNDIKDIAPLAVLGQLKTLDLGHNQIVDVQALREMPRLEWLDLSENQIKSITPLERLQKIWFLSLANNQVTDIDVLRQHQLLEEVYLQNNMIKDLSALQSAKQLLGLDVTANPLGQSVRKSPENCPNSQQVGNALKEFCGQR